ncbi:C39 family peptidase [Clostridiaceae bacterium HSG29]|nr:C39 family peptidase [Clostridiaceae bacterium HSG29]
MSLVIIEKKDFLKGAFNNLELINNSLVLKKGNLSGSYESEEIKINEFKKIVASWNTITEKDTSIELMVSFCKNEKWSMWFSYGKWSNNGLNEGSIFNQQDELGKINIDTINVKNGFSKVLKVKVLFKRKNNKLESPLLRRIILSSFNEYKNKDFKLIDIDIDVPMISQMNVPKIGKSICSPTSLTMLINNYDYLKNVYDVSQKCFDNGAGVYGNWSYNMAYASEIGFKSFIRFCENVDILIKYVSSGIPVAASIKTTNEDDLKGAPQIYPLGHLLVIRGFSTNGNLKIVVNDPASKDVKNVKKYYDFSEFLKVWNKIIYVLELEK